MAKVLKVAGWLFGIVLLLLVVASVAIALFFDLNDYKPRIVALVKDKTGRDLTIDGDIKAILLPKPGVKVGAIALANAGGFGPEPFASIESGEASIKLLPLIQKKLELDSVSIQGLALNLARDKSGKPNWEGLQAQEGQQEANPMALAVGDVALDDATITLADRSRGTLLTLENLKLRKSALAPDQSVEFDVKSDVMGAGLAGHVETHATARLDPEQERYQVNGALLNAQLTGERLQNQKVELRLDGMLVLDAELQRFSFEDLKLKVTSGGPDISGVANLAGTGVIALDDRHYDFKNLLIQAEAGGVKAEGELRGAASFDQPKMVGNLKIAEFNPREVMRRFGIELPKTSDAGVLRKAAFTTEIEASSDRTDFNKLALKLDDSTLSGDIAIKHLPKPAATFALTVDQINLDRYRPPGGSERGAAGGGGQTLPLDALRGQNIQGTLRIGKLKVLNERADNFVIKIDTRETGS